MDIKIKHNRKNHKFTATIDGYECCLNYRMPREDIIEYYHTFVPDALRGRGIAAHLVEAGLKFAEKNKMRVIPSCSYVSVYIQRNEKYKSLVASEQA
jgi:predicted GNAT family acetyltransferase